MGTREEPGHAFGAAQEILAAVESISISRNVCTAPVEKRKQSGSLKEEGFSLNANRAGGFCSASSSSAHDQSKATHTHKTAYLGIIKVQKPVR